MKTSRREIVRVIAVTAGFTVFAVCLTFAFLDSPAINYVVLFPLAIFAERLTRNDLIAFGAAIVQNVFFPVLYLSCRRKMSVSSSLWVSLIVYGVFLAGAYYCSFA